MTRTPPIPEELWSTVPAAAQAAILVVLEAMERRIADREARLNQNSTNSSRPPSTDPPGLKRRPPTSPTGRHRSAQPGHTRHCRALVPPERVEGITEGKPDHCRRWGHDLGGDDPQPLIQQVAEIPPIRPVVTEDRLHRLDCPRWGTTTCGALPTGVPTGAFGPRLHAMLSLLAGGYRLGQRPIQQMTRDLFGLSISLGMISKLRRQTAALLERPVAELRKHVPQAAVVHIDETSWRQDRSKAWLWVALTPMVKTVTIAATRCAAVWPGRSSGPSPNGSSSAIGSPATGGSS